MTILPIIIAALRRMPPGLRLVSLTFLLLTLCLPAAILPVGECFVQGNLADFREFWHRGGGIIFLTVGLLSAALFYGFVAARHWARHLAAIFGWAVAAADFIYWRGFTSDVVFGALLFGILPSWYLYCRQPVREYFGVSQGSHAA
jgi:hypothetical protein